MEAWKSVPSALDYEVSDHGQVRRATPHRCSSVGRILRQYDRNGYASVVLYGRVRMVHRLVAEAFHGPAPSPGHQAAHNNGDRRDNRSINLRWATHAENFADRYRHGTDPAGEKNGNARLTSEDVLIIRSRAMFGERHKDIARLWETSEGYVNRIVARKVWAHLEF